MKIDIKLMADESFLPEYGSDGAGGADLRANIKEPLIVAPGQKVKIPTGIALYICDPGYIGLLCSRSGHALRDFKVNAEPGLIDSDFQGELTVNMKNFSNVPYTINHGERFCQIAIVPVVRGIFNIVENFSETSARGEKGFGSTGKMNVV